MRCPTCGCRRVFDSFFVQVYQCGYAVDVSTDTIIQKCGGDGQGEPPKPRCETCPLWENCHKSVCPAFGVCHVDNIETTTCDHWYCRQHPGYEAWSRWEYNRRLRETGGAK
jgi:hypothetical protein